MKLWSVELSVHGGIYRLRATDHEHGVTQQGVGNEVSGATRHLNCQLIYKLPWVDYEEYDKLYEQRNQLRDALEHIAKGPPNEVSNAEVAAWAVMIAQVGLSKANLHTMSEGKGT